MPDGRSQKADECREMLGPERFEDLERQMVALPPEVDRAAVYEAITDGARLLWAHESLHPEIVGALADALDNLERAIKGLKRAWAGMPRSPLADEDRPAYIPRWPGEGLEREFRMLDAWGVRDTRETLLGEAAPGKGGRPRAEWRAETDAELKRLGVPKLLRRSLLGTAGLIAPRKPNARR
jgi:hypothetical protein